MAATTTLHSTHQPNPYTGQIAVHFEEDGQTGRLKSIRIKTDRLELRPATPEDIDAYDAIYGDAENMALYQGGRRSREQTIQCLNMYTDLWLGRGKYADTPYPYSGFAIVYKEQVVGNIVLGNGEEKGQAQIACAINSKFQGLGIGKEAITAIVQGLAPELFKKGYLINLHESSPSGESISGELNYIKATSAPKNTYSWYILEDIGFSRFGYDENSDRFDYRISIEKLLTQKT